jgi:GTP-binding protein
MAMEITPKQEKLRDIAIIAHVDHGKTTLVDAFLKQSHLFRDNQSEMTQNQILDSGELEKEKGITIKAKNIAIHYKDYKINIIDTPGHADFGGEVERTLNMADGCLLLVDAQEGPMPQTEFVLKKALELKLKPIVVINKIDKKFASVAKVVDKLHNLFLKLATDPDQLDFPMFYAIAREGKIFAEMPSGDLTVANSTEGNLIPLLDKIIEYIPAPKGDPDGPLQMQINALDFDAHLGRFLIGRVYRGSAKVNDNVVVVHGPDSKDKRENGKIKKLFVREGLEFKEVESVSVGDIAAVIGVESLAIGGTICPASHVEALPKIKISPPAVKIKFEANTSPLVGQDGKFVTATQLDARLEQESEQNISLTITKADGGGYFVAGRGELQLSILIETIRREGYEFQVRKPEIVIQMIEGVKSEPLEELILDTQEVYIGTITEALTKRKGELVNIESTDSGTRMTYKILTRNLFGLRSQLLTATKGNVVLNNYILEYKPVSQQQELYRRGVLIASEGGTAIGYSLNTVQERGDMFIKSGEQVYEGMIVGINKFEEDMEVNVTRARAKSGVRIKHDEITQTQLRPVIPLTLEYALVFLAKDEILEVTPKSLRLRKQYLTKNERVWSKRKNLTAFAKQKMQAE